MVDALETGPVGEGVQSASVPGTGSVCSFVPTVRAFAMEYRAVPGKLCSRAVRRLSCSSEVTLAWILQPCPRSDQS